MVDEHDNTVSTEAAAVWLLACVAFAAVAGGFSTWIARSVAPLVVFPLLLGFVLGACLAASRRMVGVANRKTVLAAAVLAAGAAVWGQHYASYREACRRAEEESETFRQARLALGDLVQGREPVAPIGLIDYMRQESRQGRALSTLWGPWVVRGWQAWASWAADAALVFVALLAATILALRRPSCPECNPRVEGDGPIFAETKTGTVPAETTIGTARSGQVSPRTPSS